MGKHTCHAYKCNVIVKPRMLMCLKHWNMVPLDLRHRVVTSFDYKQCEGKIRPSPEWLKAAREAINFVTKAEGNWETEEPTQRQEKKRD